MADESRGFAKLSVQGSFFGRLKEEFFGPFAVRIRELFIMSFARRRLVFALLIPLVVSACVPDPVPPDLATRESFAKSVMLTAASGSVDQLEKMVEQDQAAFRPEAQRLVDFAKGWDDAPGDIKMSNDFPEVANVDATKKNSTETIRYRIGRSKERWTLMKGVVLNPTTNGGGAATGVPTSVATTG